MRVIVILQLFLLLNQFQFLIRQQYTDSSFGFSFWYPSDWQVAQVPVQNPSKYPGEMVEKQLNITGQQRVITIEEYVLPGSTITDSTGVGACPVCSTTRYYFNFNLHTWMASFPDDTTSGMYDGTPYVAGSSIPANGISEYHGRPPYAGGFNAIRSQHDHSFKRE